MSKRTPSIVVGDILHCISQIERYTDQLSFEDFSTDFMVVEACLYNFQVIGEAVVQLADDVKENSPQIPWRLIKGMRNRLIHEYFGTDLPLVWNTIKNDLLPLKTALALIQSKLQEQQR